MMKVIDNYKVMGHDVHFRNRCVFSLFNVFVWKCCGASGFQFLSGLVWVPVFPSTHTFIHIKTFSLNAILVLAPTFLSFLPPNVIRTQTWKHEEKVILARLKLCQQNFELCQTSSDIWISGLKVFLLWFIMNYPSVLWQSRVLDSCHSLIPKKLKKLLFKSRNFFNFPFQLNHYAQVCKTQDKKFAWWRYTLLVLLSFSTKSPRRRIQSSVIRARYEILPSTAQYKLV